MTITAAHFSTPAAQRATISSRAGSIWTLPWADIQDWELIPGCPLKSDVWTIPAHWASGGALKRISMRTINFIDALPDGWRREDHRSDSALRRFKRLACLMFLRTLRLGDKYKAPPKPSTWVRQVRALARVTQSVLSDERTRAEATTSSCPDGFTFFKHLSASQLLEARNNHTNFAHQVIPRLNGLLVVGAFDDWPAPDVESARYEKNPAWTPFNDEFTSALCAAALWTMEVIGPDLLECWSELNALETRGRTRTIRQVRNAFIATWQGRVLKPGFPFAYEFTQVSHDGRIRARREFKSWPPTHPEGLRSMLNRLQEAHGIIISLGTGPRDGEATDLRRDCLMQLQDGDVLIGHTFKLSDDPEGERRQWPLPKTVVQAIRQQQKLAELVDPGGAYLFVQFRNTRSTEDGKRSLLLLAAFASHVKLLAGPPLAELCVGNVHSHRFRKTVVRLAALSLMGANQILFDILGHRDPEMTLNYILSDPQLQDDMRQIAKEASIALAVSALKTAKRNGGPAASRVDELATRLIPRSGPEELEIDGLNRAAELLSQGGRVMLVRRGVLCTKTFNQAGPCTQRAGNPDIGNCSPNCVHRLELEAAKADHRHSISQILELIPDQGNFMRPWFQGQLVAHLAPFPDLRSEMLCNPRVRAALQGASQVDVENFLEPSARSVAKAIFSEFEA